MPNHVFNTVYFTGTYDELAAVRKALAMQHEAQMYHKNYDHSAFNFFNVISPDKDIWEEYYGPQTRSTSLEESLKFASNHWYDWNVRNWGTKWNAYDIEVEHPFDEEHPNDAQLQMRYGFSTAWSPPENVIYAMPEFLNKVAPGVTFSWYYEEEQGWGGELEYDGTEIIIVSQFDIPDSHKDYVNRDNVESCVCSWADDPEDWYSDCPKTAVE